MSQHVVGENPLLVPLGIGVVIFVLLLAGVGFALLRASNRGTAPVAVVPENWTTSSATGRHLGAIRVYSQTFLGLTNSHHLILDGNDVGVFGRKKSVRVLAPEGPHRVAVALMGQSTDTITVTVAPGAEVAIAMVFDMGELGTGPLGRPNLRGGLALVEDPVDP